VSRPLPHAEDPKEFVVGRKEPDGSMLQIDLYRCIVRDMNAFQLITLGRRLTRIGEEAARGSRSRVPGGVVLIVDDVIRHPDSSIGEIAERTGLPQSHVSATVAKLRDAKRFRVRADPSDGRRTLVRVEPELARAVGTSGASGVERAIAEALKGSAAGDVEEVVELLERLAAIFSIAIGDDGPRAVAAAKEVGE